MSTTSSMSSPTVTQISPQNFNQQFPQLLQQYQQTQHAQQPQLMFPQQMQSMQPMLTQRQAFQQEPDSDVVSFPLNRMLTLTKSQTKTVKKNLKKMRRSGNTNGGILLAIPFAFYDGKKKHHKTFSVDDDSSSSSSSTSSSSTEYEYVRRKKEKPCSDTKTTSTTEEN